MNSSQTPFLHFPAVLVAGTPGCGKSVLSYLLTQHLRQANISHYLLRAAPDGEGDWFLQANNELVRLLRSQNKTGFSPQFVAHMQNAIQNRHLPLLVDVGGLPRGEQFGVIRACTHAILLYKEEEGLAAWKTILQSEGVPILAELQSTLQQPGEIRATFPALQGRISGLERTNPQPDLTFGALLDRLAGLFRYEEREIEEAHLRQAQFPPLLTRKLLQQIDSYRNPALWQPADLLPLAQLLPQQEAFSLYGRGPVWLAAAVAVLAPQAPLTLYDAREGWLTLPEVQEQQETAPSLKVSLTPLNEHDLLQLTPNPLLDPRQPLRIPALPPAPQRGLLLSGKLPRWAYAALARHFAPQRKWLGVHIPAEGQAVVIHTQDPSHPLGACATQW